MVMCLTIFTALLFAVPTTLQTFQESGSTPNSELLNLFPNYGTDWIFIKDSENHLKIGFLKDPHIAAPAVSNRYLLWSMDHLRESVSFRLYTRNNKQEGEVLLPTIDSILKSSFDPNKPTKSIVHGWTSSGKSEFSLTIKDEYLTYNDYNIILVDWKSIAEDTFYPKAAIATKYVGQYYAILLNNLIESGTNPSNIHLIGFSLGAHIIGYGADRVSKGTIGRVTGLDPAGPGFHYVIDSGLSPSCAAFVDIIHTSSLGIFKNVGHADFFPNGGNSLQPGCKTKDILLQYCSHGISWQYFKESINSKSVIPFLAQRCDNLFDFDTGYCVRATTALMGEHVSHSSRGTYYLKTRSISPYSLS